MLYGPEFEALKLNVELVSRIEQNIEKLLSGRIDAFLAWAPDIDAVLTKKNIQLVRGKSFVIHNDAFLCHDTPKTRQFIVEFNRGITIHYVQNEKTY